MYPDSVVPLLHRVDSLSLSVGPWAKGPALALPVRGSGTSGTTYHRRNERSKYENNVIITGAIFIV